MSKAGNVGIAAGIHSDAVCFVRTGPADKGGINKLSSRGIQLENKRVRRSTLVFGLSRRLHLKVTGGCSAGNIDGALRVHGNSVGDLRARPAEKCRVHQLRIDDERLRLVIRTNPESDAISADQVSRINSLLMTIDLLVHARFSLYERIGIGCQNEIAGRIHRRAAHSRKPDADVIGIRSRFDDEIVLEEPRVPVILHINARVDFGISDFLI